MAAWTIEACKAWAAFWKRTQHGRPQISPAMVPTAVDLARRYLPYRAFPGKAVRLLEELRVAHDANRDESGEGKLLGDAELYAAFSWATGIPIALAEWIGGFKLAPWALLSVLTAFYIVLGCFLDGISMVVLTTSIIIPLVTKSGFDLIWFGIYIVLVVEMAQITPPVGFNLYVLQGMTGRNIFTIGAYALPLFFLMCVAVALVTMFPAIALWLPSTMLDASH